MPLMFRWLLVLPASPVLDGYARAEGVETWAVRALGHDVLPAV